jgi:hypothetical protein
MNAAIILQSGFRTPAAPGTGTYKLWRKLLEAFPNRRTVPLLALREWDSDPERLVQLTLNLHVDQIVHVGHSYGWGKGGLSFFGELSKVGRNVDLSCVIDGVLWYRLMKWRSLRRGQRHEVPPNVLRVWSARQDNGPPYGFQMVASAPTELVDSWIYNERNGRGVTHQNIDDLPEIHEGIITRIREVLG